MPPAERYFATAAALAIVVADNPPWPLALTEAEGMVATSAEGMRSQGRHFGVGRPVVGGHFDPRFDWQFGRSGGRAIFRRVGGIFLGYDFGSGLGFRHTQATTLPGIASQVPLRLQPCRRGLLLSVSWPGVLMRSHYQTAALSEYIACNALPCSFTWKDLLTLP